MARRDYRSETHELRGFALYVGLNASDADASGVGLGEIVDLLKRELHSLVPLAESHALAVVAPVGTTATDLDVVLQGAIERSPEQDDTTPDAAAASNSGVVIDLARHRILVDGSDAAPTLKEFDLLETLVRNQGKTLSRAQLRVAIAGDDVDTNDRSIDVHVRRLRIKFGEYPDVIRTIYRKGYRFEPRSDVTVVRDRAS